MKIFIERTKEEKEIKFQGTVNELLKKLAINGEAVLVTRNNELLTAKDKIEELDAIKILSVVSGG